LWCVCMGGGWLGAVRAVEGGGTGTSGVSVHVHAEQVCVCAPPARCVNPARACREWRTRARMPACMRARTHLAPAASPIPPSSTRLPRWRAARPSMIVGVMELSPLSLNLILSDAQESAQHVRRGEEGGAGGAARACLPADGRTRTHTAGTLPHAPLSPPPPNPPEPAQGPRQAGQDAGQCAHWRQGQRAEVRARMHACALCAACCAGDAGGSSSSSINSINSRREGSMHAGTPARPHARARPMRRCPSPAQPMRGQHAGCWLPPPLTHTHARTRLHAQEEEGRAQDHLHRRQAATKHAEAAGREPHPRHRGGEHLQGQLGRGALHQPQG